MEKIKAVLNSEEVSSNSIDASALNEKQGFGEKERGKVIYMNEEAFFLLEENKMEIFSSGFKKLSNEEVIKKMIRINKKFLTRYKVYRDLRKKGMVVKSGLKFGGDFRVYDKGIRMGRGHSKWVCFCESENKSFTAQDFAAKNRVAHSTKKNLLLAIVDSEGDVTYYEFNWKKIV